MAFRRTCFHSRFDITLEPLPSGTNFTKNTSESVAQIFELFPLCSFLCPHCLCMVADVLGLVSFKTGNEDIIRHFKNSASRPPASFPRKTDIRNAAQGLSCSSRFIMDFRIYSDFRKILLSEEDPAYPKVSRSISPTLLRDLFDFCLRLQLCFQHRSRDNLGFGALLPPPK